MPSSNDFPQHLPLHRYYPADPFASGLGSYVRYAIQALSERDQLLPDLDGLTRIVTAALSAQTLYFAAAVYDPGREDLHQFFETFILTCVTPPMIRSTP
jgi:hypothetical protein